jgi:hypothetical protein
LPESPRAISYNSASHVPKLSVGHNSEVVESIRSTFIPPSNIESAEWDSEEGVPEPQSDKKKSKAIGLHRPIHTSQEELKSKTWITHIKYKRCCISNWDNISTGSCTTRRARAALFFFVVGIFIYLGEAELSIKDRMLQAFQLRLNHDTVLCPTWHQTKLGEAKATWLSDTNNSPLDALNIKQHSPINDSYWPFPANVVRSH